MILSILVFAGLIVAGSIAVNSHPDPIIERREREYLKHYLDIPNC